MVIGTFEVRGGATVCIGQVLDPDQAIALGQLGQRFSRLQPGQDSLGFPSRRVLIEEVSETEDQLDLMKGVGRFLDKLVESRGYSAEVSEVDVLVGAAVRGEWHIDRIHDQRVLVNISEFPIYLDVATEWNGREWVDPLRGEDSPYPSSYERISYLPGEAVLIDNMRNPVEQVPHRGSTQPGKILLRALARQL